MRARTHLPVCNFSPKMKYASIATITVERGLNMVTKTGPFSLVHHNWMKSINPEHTTAYGGKFIFFNYSNHLKLKLRWFKID